MRKKDVFRKLTLKKTTISDLTKKNMNILRGGSGDPTCIGRTCYTGPCCRSNDCL